MSKFGSSGVGIPGPKGTSGAQGPAGPSGAKGNMGVQGVKGDTGAVGPSGSTLVGQVSLSENGLITLALSVRRITVDLAGTVTSGSYVAVPTAALPAGFSVQDCVCSAANKITIGLLVPVLSVLGSYSIPVRVYRLG